MACNPPSAAGKTGESQIIITSDLTDAKEAVDQHFVKSIGAHAHTTTTRQWPERNLPEEFFSKPSTKSSANTSVAHSRDGSTDSSGRFTMSPPAAFGVTAGGAGGNSLLMASVQHSRTQSSPATLSAHMSLPPPPPGPPYGATNGRSAQANAAAMAAGRHASAGQQTGSKPQYKHRSVDNTLDVVDHSPLPNGWERKFTENGQPFYVNSVDRTTTWEDPRKSLSASNLSPHGVVTCPTPNSAGGANAATNAQHLGPLPPGWEESMTPNGEKYFINHNERTTSWYDPRLPEELQKPVIVQRLLSQQQQQKGHHRHSVSSSPSCAMGRHAAAAAHHHHHHHQHQSGSAAAARAQLPPQIPAGSRAAASTAGVGAGAAAASFSSPMIQELNQERLRIYERNMELREQGLLDRLSPVHPLSPGRNVGMDTFLDAAAANQYANQHHQHMMTGGPQPLAHYPPTTTADFHIRQESSDSGLGMPVGYPHTPENYLGSSDIDLSFSGINLVDPPIPMEVDPTGIPATLGEIGIAPNELDQYLNH